MPFRVPHSAFSVIELLVVLVVIGIAAGMIVPRMGSSLTRQELREAAGRFAVTARTVRELAVARGQPFAIEIDLERGYAVSMQSSQRGGQSQPVRASWLQAAQWPASVRKAAAKTPDGQTIAQGTHRLVFNPDGSSSGIDLRLQGADESEVCDVVVYPHTGRVVLADTGKPPPAAEQMDMGD